MFQVNNFPVFLKGTNWIPADSFLANVTEQRLQYYFHSMAEVGMNSLRVWGGGVYESDAFYELADRFGFLIWQDFMFAVALYPADESFLHNVRLEVQDFLWRAGHHASIAVLAGNNENELGLQNAWFHPDHPSSHAQYKDDYLRLYNTTIWGSVNASHFPGPFVLSSPSNGVQTIAEGGVAANAGSFFFGDVHFYSYTADAWNPASFPIPRCVTEFGYQSLPSLSSLQHQLGATNLSFWSPALMHRQHHPGGNAEILAAVLLHFPLPRCRDAVSTWLQGPGTFQIQAFNSFAQLCEDSFASSDPAATELRFLGDIVYLNQIHQAVAYQTEIEHYRRWRNRTSPHTGLGNSMCALYWQLNDIWTAPSWASIDYFGVWKPAHYFLRRAFATRLLSPFREQGNLVVGFINDAPLPLVNASLRLRLFRWGSGARPLHSRLIAIDPVPAASSRIVYTTNLRALLRVASNRPHTGRSLDEEEELIVELSLCDSKGVVTDEGARNLLLPSSFYGLDPQQLGSAKIDEAWVAGKREFGLRVAAVDGRISPFVWLELSSRVQSWDANRPLGHFSDNGFTLLAEAREIKFQVWSANLTLAQFRAALRVRTLRELYVEPAESSTM